MFEFLFVLTLFTRGFAIFCLDFSDKNNFMLNRPIMNSGLYGRSKLIIDRLYYKAVLITFD